MEIETPLTLAIYPFYLYLLLKNRQLIAFQTISNCHLLLAAHMMQHPISRCISRSLSRFRSLNIRQPSNIGPI